MFFWLYLLHLQIFTIKSTVFNAGSLNRDAIAENRRQRYMIDAGVSLVVQESFRESLFKNRYFVSGIGSGITKRFKYPAQDKLTYL